MFNGYKRSACLWLLGTSGEPLEFCLSFCFCFESFGWVWFGLVYVLSARARGSVCALLHWLVHTILVGQVLSVNYLTRRDMKMGKQVRAT